jgi:hypothetical protein
MNELLKKEFKVLPLEFRLKLCENLPKADRSVVKELSI